MTNENLTAFERAQGRGDQATDVRPACENCRDLPAVEDSPYCGGCKRLTEYQPGAEFPANF